MLCSPASCSCITKPPGTFIAAEAAFSGGQVTHDTWHDLWHMTRAMTCDTWHVKQDFIDKTNLCKYSFKTNALVLPPDPLLDVVHWPKTNLELKHLKLLQNFLYWDLFIAANSLLFRLFIEYLVIRFHCSYCTCFNLVCSGLEHGAWKEWVRTRDLAPQGLKVTSRTGAATTEGKKAIAKIAHTSSEAIQKPA